MFEFTRRALVIGGFALYWYGIIIAAGVLAGCLLAMAREKRLSLRKDTALDLVLWGVPAAVVCARLYYVVFSWEYYASAPAEIFDLRDGGLAVYGGLLGGLLAGWLYSRRKKLSFGALADLAAPSFALGQCIGRWGNFINREAYGAAVENPALQFFPFAVFIDGAGWRYATFFYESLWCGLIVIVLLAAERKRLFSRRGDLFLTYIFLYALERCVVEGLRADSLYIGPLRVSQLISILAVICVCAVMARRRKGILRFMPLSAALLMAVAAALQSTLLTALAGLFALGSAAGIVIFCKDPDNG